MNGVDVGLVFSFTFFINFGVVNLIYDIHLPYIGLHIFDGSAYYFYILSHSTFLKFLMMTGGQLIIFIYSHIQLF
jgi:hypothetical protein